MDIVGYCRKISSVVERGVIRGLSLRRKKNDLRDCHYVHHCIESLSQDREFDTLARYKERMICWTGTMSTNALKFSATTEIVAMLMCTNFPYFFFPFQCCRVRLKRPNKEQEDKTKSKGIYFYKLKGNMRESSLYSCNLHYGTKNSLN